MNADPYPRSFVFDWRAEEHAEVIRLPVRDQSRSGFWRAFHWMVTIILALSLVVAEAILWSPPASGQAQRTFGIHFGQLRSLQLWSGPASSERDNGFSLGLNVDVPTPLPILSIRAEIGYVRRGGVLWDEAGDPDRLATSRVRSHYLSIPVHGKLRFGLGPAAGYVFFGPTIDQLLDTQCTQGFCSVISEEKPSVLNVAVGSGVSVDVRNRFRGEFEFRITEGLTGAYRLRESSVRNRSLEVLLRACFPF